MLAVGHQINRTGNSHRTSADGGAFHKMAGQPLGRINGCIDLVHSLRACRTCAGNGRIVLSKAPHRIECDDFTRIATHDGRRIGAERFKNGGTGFADARGDRI